MNIFQKGNKTAVLSQRSTTNSLSWTPGIAYSGAYTITVRALGTMAVGPDSVAVPLLTGTPTVTDNSYDGKLLSVKWTADTEPGVTGYNVGVFDGKSEVASIQASGTSAALPVSLDPTKSYTVQVQSVGAGTQGAWSASMAMITASPVITYAQFKVAGKAPNNTLTVNWSPATGSDNYMVSVYQGDDNVPVEATITGTSATVKIKQPQTGSASFNETVPYTVVIKAPRQPAVSSGPLL